MLDHGEIRDCVLLATAVYLTTEAQIGDFLAQYGHRFNGGITCSNVGDSEGHFVVAQMRCDIRMTTYLAVRGSVVLEDWQANVHVWPTLQNVGMVHAGWYARVLHLPVKFLIQCIRDGHRVVITGHSIGASVAQLLALSMLQTFAGDAEAAECRSRIMCVSIAGPMVVSGQSAISGANEHYSANFVNFVHSKDIVPKILSYGQAALQELANQNGGQKGQKSAAELAAMLRNIIDPSVCEELSAQMFATVVKAGIAAILRSAAIVLSYGPIGHYYRIDVPTGTPLAPLSAAELQGMMTWNLVDLSLDAVHAHSMRYLYLQAVLARLAPDSARPTIRTAPPSLRLPRPVISRVHLHRSGKQVLVEIFGSDLYMIKSVEASSDFPLCNLNAQVSAEALVNASKLSFTVDSVCSEVHKSVPISGTTTAQLAVSAGLCWTENILFPSVLVTIVNTSPLDLCTLQELIAAGTYLLIFVSRQPGHVDHPTLSELRKLLIEILSTVPLSSFFSPPDTPVCAHCFKNYPNTVFPILLQDAKGPAAIDDYINHLQKLYDTLPPSEKVTVELDAHIKEMRAHRNGRQEVASSQDSILTLLARCQEPPQEGPEEGLKVLLQVLQGPLNRVLEALHMQLTHDTYSRFVCTLEAAMGSVLCLGSSVGRYYNPSQRRLGPLYDSWSTFLNNPLVRQTMQSFYKSSLVQSGAASLLTSAVLMLRYNTFWPSAALTLTGFAAGVGAFGYFSGKEIPHKVRNSSADLCAVLLQHLGVNFPEGATTGDTEAVLALKLALTGCGPCSQVSDFSTVARECFPRATSAPSFPDVPRRVKLAVLSAALRSTLKQLPVALVTGPARSGKSTFREYMRPTPDRSQFGPDASQRTSVPELFFCGDPGRPIGILDTIGLGDTTHVDAHAAVDEANKLFRMFCRVSVYVVAVPETVVDDSSLMFRTSTVPRRSEKSAATTADHPSITCITKVDRWLGVGGSFVGVQNGPASLLERAAERVVMGDPFDLRSPQEDPFSPRVMACFEEGMPLPQEYHGVVCRTAQVRDWLYAQLYPQS
jgi:hypothetical protein